MPDLDLRRSQFVCAEPARIISPAEIRPYSSQVFSQVISMNDLSPTL